MPRSLQATLLAWYSLVLVAVLVTFTTVAVWTMWRSNLENLDGRLSAMASRLASAVTPDPGGQYEVNLVGDDLAEFGATENAPYYAIWTDAGALIDRSDPLVETAFPGTPQIRIRDGHREVVVRADHGALVLVGQSLVQTRSDIWRVVVGLAAAGGAALLLALLGGWFLVGRALAPIGRIAQTAEAMSESNLGLRIDVGRTEDELGSVATALNRAFDRLEDAFERQGRFTADASHELRTPLTTFIAELDWALARRRSDSEYQNSLRVCMKAAQRMRNVVEGLLTLARADAGAIEQGREAVDIARLAGEIVAGVGPSAAERGIHLRAEGETAIVDGDPDRLRELISNLVLNAVQYSSAGCTVICSISAVDGKASLEVSDTGPGIDPEDLPHVFERFYRANKARSRAAGGAGLGLAISKWIAESHGGQIRCESANGRGTRFTVEFPKAPGVTNGVPPISAQRKVIRT